MTATSTPEFTKKKLFKHVIVDFDDWEDRYDRNTMSELFYMKATYPKFKCTLFSIPGRISEQMVELIKPLDWIQHAVHGWKHETNFEVRDWDEYQCNLYLNKAEAMGLFVKGFKAPGWEMSDTMRKVLLERDYWLAEHAKNDDHVKKEFPNLKVYSTTHPWCMHGHTWPMPSQDPMYRNGTKQFIEEHGLPFNQETEFHFIDDIWINK